MKSRCILIGIILSFLCTGCLIKQPKEEIIYNINIEQDSTTEASTVNITAPEEVSTTDATLQEDVQVDNYSEETLEFDKLIKEISDQTKE